MPSIYEAVTSKNISTYWQELRKQRKPFLGEALFPNRKQLGLDLSWIKGADNAPVALQLSAFDAKAIPLSRNGFERLMSEMPFFKNSKNIDEKQRQKLNTVINSGNQDVINIVLNNIFNDKAQLLRNADITREIMRMQLITTGTLSLASNGQSYTYDYKLNPANKVTAKWSDKANANPIIDIKNWQDLVENNTGERPTKLIMNLVTFNMLLECDHIKNSLYVFAQGKVDLDESEVKSYIKKHTGCDIYIYNKGYMDDTGKFKKFVPDKVVSLCPNMIGNFWFGTTPEESDLLNSPNIANVSIVDMGVAVTTSKEIDPVNVMTKVSMIGMPSGENINQLVIATIS